LGRSRKRALHWFGRSALWTRSPRGRGRCWCLAPAVAWPLSLDGPQARSVPRGVSGLALAGPARWPRAAARVLRTAIPLLWRVCPVACRPRPVPRPTLRGQRGARPPSVRLSRRATKQVSLSPVWTLTRPQWRSNASLPRCSARRLRRAPLGVMPFQLKHMAPSLP
jgi:hypothetical protein